MKLTKGAGVTAVIPCCPGNEPFAEGISLLKKRGRFGFFSGLVGDSPFSKDHLNIIHYRELNVSGGYGCRVSNNREAVHLLSGGFDRVEDLPFDFISWDELESRLGVIESPNKIFTCFNP